MFWSASAQGLKGRKNSQKYILIIEAYSLSYIRTKQNCPVPMQYTINYSLKKFYSKGPWNEMLKEWKAKIALSGKKKKKQKKTF